MDVKVGAFPKQDSTSIVCFLKMNRSYGQVKLGQVKLRLAVNQLGPLNIDGCICLRKVAGVAACGVQQHFTSHALTTMVDKVRIRFEATCGFPQIHWCRTKLEHGLPCFVRRLKMGNMWYEFRIRVLVHTTLQYILCACSILERKTCKKCRYTRWATCQFQRHYTLYCAFHSSLIVFV